MIDLNKEMSITDSERSELVQHLFDDMFLLKQEEKLESMQSSEVYNHFVDKAGLPGWISQRINKDFLFAANLHEMIIRYKDSFTRFPI